MKSIPINAPDHRFWFGFARQLAHPRGLAGRVVGWLMRGANRRPTQLAVQALDIQPNAEVLDLGCGPGDAIALIARTTQATKIHGLDQSAVMLDQARARCRQEIRTGRVALMQGEFEHLPYPDRSFDRILASNVMYFWHDASRVLDELRRVLRPGGRIVIYVTSAAAMRHWKFAGAPTHRLFDQDTLRHELEQGGFSPDHVTVMEIALPGNVSGLMAMASKRPDTI